jgi:hypothetical protein
MINRLIHLIFNYTLSHLILEKKHVSNTVLDLIYTRAIGTCHFAIDDLSTD